MGILNPNKVHTRFLRWVVVRDTKSNTTSKFPNTPSKTAFPKGKRKPNSKSNAHENAISAKSQKFGNNIAECTIKEKKCVHDSGKEKCREEAEKSKAIRERNKAIINLYSHVAHELNDEYEKSTGTSLVKMYEAWNPIDCEKSLETFTDTSTMHARKYSRSQTRTSSSAPGAESPTAHHCSRQLYRALSPEG